MPKINPLSHKDLIRVLEKTGFRIIRQKGSHVIMMNSQGTRIVMPVHPGKDVKPGLIRAILKEAGLSREKSFKLLKRAFEDRSARTKRVVDIKLSGDREKASADATVAKDLIGGFKD